MKAGCKYIYDNGKQCRLKPTTLLGFRCPFGHGYSADVCVTHEKLLRFGLPVGCDPCARNQQKTVLEIF